MIGGHVITMEALLPYFQVSGLEFCFAKSGSSLHLCKKRLLFKISLHWIYHVKLLSLSLLWGLLEFWVQKFDIWPTLVRVDYSPCRVDLAALRGGKYVELINLVPWKVFFLFSLFFSLLKYLPSVGCIEYSPQ